MQIELSFKTDNNTDAIIPFNYNYQLSSAIYSKIEDSNYSEELHKSVSFKFFTFSQIFIEKIKINRNNMIAKRGRVKFYLASPDNYFIKNVVSGFINNPYLRIGNQYFNLSQIKEIKNNDIKTRERVKTISPIISRTLKEINGELKVFDLAPNDHFFRNLEQNLLNKYLKFNNLQKTNKKIKITSEMRNVKEKRIMIKKKNNKIYQRCYLMDLILEGDFELIKFAYATGLGEKNSMGFGMIEKDIK